MLIQLHLKPTDARAAKAYRLQVKERLYRFNYVSVQMILIILCMSFIRERLVFVNIWGLTNSVYAGSTCSARGEGPLREARRDVSERLRRLSENIGHVAMMWVSSGGQVPCDRSQPLPLSKFLLHALWTLVSSSAVICGYARSPGHCHFCYHRPYRLCETTWRW